MFSFSCFADDFSISSAENKGNSNWFPLDCPASLCCGVHVLTAASHDITTKSSSVFTKEQTNYFPKYCSSVQRHMKFTFMFSVMYYFMMFFSLQLAFVLNEMTSGKSFCNSFSNAIYPGLSCCVFLYVWMYSFYSLTKELK